MMEHMVRRAEQREMLTDELGRTLAGHRLCERRGLQGFFKLFVIQLRFKKTVGKGGAHDI